MIRKLVARTIHDIVEERGISVYKLTKECKDVSPATIYNAVNGKGGIGLDTLGLILKALGVTPSEFFSWNQKDEGVHLTQDQKLVVEVMEIVPEYKKERLIGYALALLEETKRDTPLQEKELP